MKNTKRERKRDAKNHTSPLKALSISIISGLGCSATAVIFMAIGSLYALSKEDPEKTISVLGIVIPAICYVASGFISHRLSHRSPLICGAISAATLMAVLKFASFVCKADSHASFNFPIKIALGILYVFLSVISAILSANLYLSSKSSSKKRKKSISHKK